MVKCLKVFAGHFAANSIFVANHLVFYCELISQLIVVVDLFEYGMFTHRKTGVDASPLQNS